MKNYKYTWITTLILIMASTSFQSCSDDFLSKYPKDKLTEGYAFVTYENFQTYAWGLYTTFGGFRTGDDAGVYTTKHNESECDSDNFNKSQSGE
ncbi:MAG: hypothetical protein LIP01_09605 [Tannerellaceae bacterium]|nr:hypothetical protein [Tannerellaceae bacterium]